MSVELAAAMTECDIWYIHDSEVEMATLVVRGYHCVYANCVNDMPWDSY